MYVAFSERVVVVDKQNSYESVVVLTYFGLGAVAGNVGVWDPKVSDVVRTLIQVESSNINIVVSVGVRTLIQVESSDINICGACGCPDFDSGRNKRHQHLWCLWVSGRSNQATSPSVVSWRTLS